MLSADVPVLILAPMDGVTDAPMRALQGESGAFTFAVSEFLRISQSVPHRGVFHRHVPELLNGGRTPTGLPVQVQLLGGDADRLARAAVVAHEAGATAIDINFGCPAPTVNRHDGGATLLKYPQRIREIVAAIRSRLPRHVPVSAKLRLGWDGVDSIFENADMAAEGGASWLTIHARTRTQGYAPPVDWPIIGRVRERLGIPVVANGDIHSLADFRRCRDATGCRHFMIGRGALANPELAGQVACELGIANLTVRILTPTDWLERVKRLADWTPGFHQMPPELSVHRMKQWLRIASKHGNFTSFEKIKLARTSDELFELLQTA
jgi:tRNA-dihydrouridine synthase C